MNIIALDFESYYSKKDFSLSKKGITTESYIRDPQFEVIGVAVMVNGGSPEWFSGTRKETRAWLMQFDWENSLLLAHNCHFDGAILNWHLGIKPKGYLDTLSMANALHGINKSVSLKSLAEQYHLQAKGTEVNDADGKHRTDFNTADLAAYGNYCKLDTWLCQTLFDLMAPSFSKAELKAISATVRMFCEPVLELDLPLLEQHLIDVCDEQASSLDRLATALGLEGGDVKTTLMSNEKFAKLLRYLGVEPPVKISLTTGKEAYAFAKTDEEFTALAEHENVTVQAAIAARLGNKTTIEESRTLAFIGVAKRGTFPFPLKYSGAAVTHRWSGFDYNVQNMGRTSVLRQSIRAPKGYKIVAADLSNIELRLGLWLAGQDDKVQLIAEGRDLYMDIASVIFGKTYEEVEALGKKSRERTVGKVVSLASIYGTGAAKLKDTIRIIGRLKVDQDEAQRMTDIYRGTYTAVTAVWDEGKDVLDAIYHKQPYGDYLKNGVMQVTDEGIMKPSGLLLTYPDLGWTADKNGRMGYTYEQKRGLRDRVYGSKVFQRSTQSLARDIICANMLDIDKRFHVAGTVHDEIICVVADSEVEEAKAFMLEVMREAPAWAPDLPLDAEIGVGDNYGDAK